MYNHKFTLVSRKTMDVKMLSILMNKIQLDSIYFSWYFPLSGVILGMMRVSTIYILYQHYISSMTWSLFRHYSWKIEKWTDDSMRFLFTTTAFTETCTGWTFTFTFWCLIKLSHEVQVHRRAGHRRGDCAQEAHQLVGLDGGGARGFVKGPKNHQLAFSSRLLHRQDDWRSHRGSDQGSDEKVWWEIPSSCSFLYLQHPWTPAHDEPRVQECKPFKRWTLLTLNEDHFQYRFRKGLHKVFHRSREGSDCF